MALQVAVQIFGLKSSQASRAAERFFKERSVPIHYIDLRVKPMSLGEIKRFVEKFGLASILDIEGAAYAHSGLKYLKVSDSELLTRIEKEPRLLRLPLVRAAKVLSIGHDEEAWKFMLNDPSR